MNVERCLSLVALAVATAIPAYASDNSNVETIVVTGQRFDSAANQELMLIQTIEREDIEAIAPLSVQELLETVPGVSLIASGNAANTSSVRIRGGESDHALVLVDGVRISSATLGSVSWGTLLPEQIERIEVLKGPRTSVWGSDAISGVIQIFTRKLEAGQWYAGAEYGSNAYLRGSAGMGIAHGSGSTTLTISREESDGFDVLQGSQPDDDGYERLSFGVTGQQALGDQLSLEWKGELNQGEYDYDNAFGSGADESEYHNYLASFGLTYQADQLASKLAVSTMRDKNEDSLAGNAAYDSFFQTKRHALNWSLRYALESLTFVTGIDVTDEKVDSNAVYSEDSRTNTGVYGLARYQYAGVTLEGAARYDDVENIDSETTYNPSAGYRFADHWRVSANVGTSFKAPTFNDLYYPFGGNPELTSETGTSYDLTLHFNQKDVDAYVSVYRNDVDDMITWVQNQSGAWLPQNIDEVELTGVELAADVTLFGFGHHVGYNYLDSENTLTGDKLPGRAQHEFDYGIDYQWEKLDIRVDYHHQGTRYAGYGSYLSSYNKVDVSVGYQLTEGWKLRLKANNVTDQDIVSNRNYNGPEREFFFSVTYSAL